MKARIKSTGEIGIVSNIDLLFGNKGCRYQSNEVEIIDSYADIEITKEPDYWEKLKHQYAGMAMQGLLANHGYKYHASNVAKGAIEFATALVEKLKEEKK